MLNKSKLIAVFFAFLVFLTGCTAFTPQNTNDLLRAPALAGEQAEIQKALSSYLKETPQYKFPKEGSFRSPLLMVDLDGDGQEESVLFYSMSATSTQKERTSNVYMAVLKKNDGEWEVVADEPGPAVDVASIEVVDMMGDGTAQLVVGYASSNLGNRKLYLYQFKDGVLESKLFGDYYKYLVGDFTGDGSTGIVVVSAATDQAGMRLNFLKGSNGQFEFAQDAVELYQNFDSCIGIYPSLDYEGKQILIIDGKVSDMTASQIFYFSSAGAGFYSLPDSAAAMVTKTSRNSAWLTSRDIDGDNIVEIPVETKIGESTDILLKGDEGNDASFLSQVDWFDFTNPEEVAKEYGILDGNYGAYISLPEEWRGEVDIKIDDTGEGWRIVRRSTGAVLITMGEKSDDNETSYLRVPGSDEAYITLHRVLKASELKQISVTMLT